MVAAAETVSTEGQEVKTTTRTIEELLKSSDSQIKSANDSPLPLHVIPNYMGINLCSVEGLTWTKQEDGQLVSLTIHFIPSSKEPQK